MGDTVSKKKNIFDYAQQFTHHCNLLKLMNLFGVRL